MAASMALSASLGEVSPRLALQAIQAESPKSTGSMTAPKVSCCDVKVSQSAASKSAGCGHLDGELDPAQNRSTC